MRFTAFISTAILAISISAFPQPELIHGGNFSTRAIANNERTDDWAGAGLTAPPADEGGFVAVIGSFKVPNIKKGDKGPAAVSVWVGIEGFNENNLVPLIQAGIDTILNDKGQVSHETWVEWVPNDAIYLKENDFIYLPGDTVQIEVIVKKGDETATAIFTNFSDPDTFSLPFSTPSTPDKKYAAKGETMEWIVERIHDKDHDPKDEPKGKLMNFGTIAITDCSGSTVKKSAGIKPSQGVAVDMKNGPNGDVNSATSVIDDTTVTVTWHAN